MAPGVSQAMSDGETWRGSWRDSRPLQLLLALPQGRRPRCLRSSSGGGAAAAGRQPRLGLGADGGGDGARSPPFCVPATIGSDGWRVATDERVAAACLDRVLRADGSGGLLQMTTFSSSGGKRDVLRQGGRDPGARARSGREPGGRRLAQHVAQVHRLRADFPDRARAFLAVPPGPACCSSPWP